MKKLFLTTCLAFAACTLFAAPKTAKIRTEQDINTYVNKMTLEEKVGQMTELAIDVLGHWEDGNFVLDKDKLERALVKYKVGSILNSPGPVAQTPEWWQKTIRTCQFFQFLFFADTAHSFSSRTLRSNHFPHSWNKNRF